MHDTVVRVQHNELPTDRGQQSGGFSYGTGQYDMLRTGGSPRPTPADMTPQLHVRKYLMYCFIFLQYPYQAVDGCLADPPCGA